MDGFIKHEESGLLVNPGTGTVIGRSGRVVGTDNSHGYIAVGWQRADGGTKGARVHRLVWEVVNGPIPNGMEINHINGVKADNRIQNLELVTRTENIRHAYATGLNRSIGQGNGRAKLTADEVATVRELHASGRTARSLAAEFGVGETAIGKIVRGERWRAAA